VVHPFSFFQSSGTLIEQQHGVAVAKEILLSINSDSGSQISVFPSQPPAHQNKNGLRFAADFYCGKKHFSPPPYRPSVGPLVAYAICSATSTDSQRWNRTCASDTFEILIEIFSDLEAHKALMEYRLGVGEVRNFQSNPKALLCLSGLSAKVYWWR
jgi:hypothetical protein